MGSAQGLTHQPDAFLVGWPGSIHLRPEPDAGSAAREPCVERH